MIPHSLMRDIGVYLRDKRGTMEMEIRLLDDGNGPKAGIVFRHGVGKEKKRLVISIYVLGQDPQVALKKIIRTGDKLTKIDSAKWRVLGLMPKHPNSLSDALARNSDERDSNDPAIMEITLKTGRLITIDFNTCIGNIYYTTSNYD